MSNPPKSPGAFPADPAPSTRPPGAPALGRNISFDPSDWQGTAERDLPPIMQDWLGHLRAGRLHAQPEPDPDADAPPGDDT